jgi:hypothetical protein
VFRPSGRADIRALLSFHQPDPVSWIDPASLRDGFAAGSHRLDWTWLAEVDGRPVARGVWWGPAGAVHPIALRCLLVDASVPHPELWGAALIRTAHRAFAQAGALLAPDLVIDVPEGWRDDAVIVHAIRWRRMAAAAAGLVTGTVHPLDETHLERLVFSAEGVSSAVPGVVLVPHR